MRKYAALAFAFAALVALPAFAGNGALSGSHYNLNLIGVPKGKTIDSTAKGKVIFVKLYGSTKIILSEGPFAVLDKNGTDGTAAFQLPVSNVDCPVDAPADDPCQYSGDYAVFIRALGQPDHFADMTTCAEDNTTHEIVCSTESVHVARYKGKSTFTNVTKELTTLCLDTDHIIEPVLCDVRTQLFSNQFWTYFWDYSNNGLKLAQLRFYDLP